MLNIRFKNMMVMIISAFPGIEWNICTCPRYKALYHVMVKSKYKNTFLHSVSISYVDFSYR